jgi:multiple sugar transport system ATP-binding protein
LPWSGRVTEEETMGNITLKKVSKSFGATVIIPNIDLTIEEGEFVVFVGPSGCGKSTLLRLIAGLEDTSSGTINIDGRDVTDEPPAKRKLAMVFQSYALYPHMSVRNNIAFPLKMAGEDKATIDKKVADAARVLNLTDYLERRPGQLSGGQRQRVAIGRAIVRQPSAFLFDEPLSNLDAALRGTMRLEISELHHQLKTTMIYVTHDQVEAMTMADKIVVLNAGNIEQVGSPMELYRKPRNLFVAGFIGSPKMNLIEGAPADKRGAKTIGIRPEHLGISTTSGEWKGTVGVAEHLGSDTFLHVHTDGIGIMTVRTEGDVGVSHGDRIYLTPDPTKLHRFGADGQAIQ